MQGLPGRYCDKFYCCYTKAEIVKLHISIPLISADIYVIFIKSEDRCIPDLSSSLFISPLGGLHQLFIESVTAITIGE